MRSILAFAVLLLCLSKAAPEPEYSSLLAGSFPLDHGASLASLVEIETSTARGDRQSVARTAPAVPPGDLSEPDSIPPQPADATGNGEAPVSLNELCNVLLQSAQQNDLPVAFFANLIWQESRMRDDAVSPKGALGIAQFMPQTAVESGLNNPLDPLQALPASARLLHELRDQFGNLGFVAAAYNAGARRVSEWLARRRTLPRETQGYVIHVTGRTVEQWQKSPVDDAALHFVRRLPCRDFPAFAQLEDAQYQQAAFEHMLPDPQPAQTDQSQPHKQQAPGKVASSKPEKEERHGERRVATTRELRRERIAERGHPHAPLRQKTIHAAEHERHHEKHEVRGHEQQAGHGKHRRA